MKRGIVPAILITLLIVSKTYGEPIISGGVINVLHVGYDSMFTEPESWGLLVEVHLSGTGFDPETINVSVDGPCASGPLDYRPFFYPGSLEYAYFTIFPIPDPSSIPACEGEYTLHVEGLEPITLNIPSGTFINMELPVTSWDPCTGLLCWDDVENADRYQLILFGSDQSIEFVIQLESTCYAISLDDLFQTVSVQAFDYASGLGFPTSQSQYITIVDAICIWGVANAEAATFGSGSVMASGPFNAIALLVVPVGAVIYLRLLRRKR